MKRILQLAVSRAGWRKAAFAAFFCLTAAAPGAARAMTFELVPYGDTSKCGRNCPEVVSAVGEITTETPGEFLDFVKRNISDQRLRSIVFIHSPGGSVAASMRLGAMFRKTGVAAIVARMARLGDGAGAAGIPLPAGRCYSACVYAFMGAKKRVVPPTSLLGIHRMSFDTFERDLDSMEYRREHHFGTPDFVARLSNYAHAMGISRDLVAVAERISPDQIHIVTPDELRRWNLGGTRF